MIKIECSCPVCSETLKKPVVLKCSHNVCYECAESLIAINGMREHEGKFLECPVCQSVSSLPRASADSLLKNLHLRSLIEDWQKTKLDPASRPCQLCMEDPSPAKFECLACELVACDECIAVHTSKQRFSHHKVVALNSKRYCQEHFLDLDFFCLNDSRLCCSKCVQFSEKHKHHDIIRADLAVQQLSGEVLQAKATLNKLDRQISISKSKLLDCLDATNSREEEHTQQLEELKNKQLLKVESVFTNKLTILQLKYEKLREIISKKVGTLDQVSGQISSLVEGQDELLILQKSKEMADLKPELLLKRTPEVLLFTPDSESFVKDLDRTCHVELRFSSPSDIHCLVYLSRGNREYTMYDFETESYSYINISEIIPRWSGFALLPNGQILVTGGKANKESGAKVTAFFLNPQTGETCPVPNMLWGHSSHVVVTVGNTVYCLSGKNQNNITHSGCEFFNSENFTWNNISPMIKGRTCAAGAYAKGHIYVVGGYQSAVNNTLEKYNIFRDQWMPIDVHLPEKLWQHGCFAVSDTQVLIYGGEGQADEAHKQSYLFNTETNTFTGNTPLSSNSTWLFFWLHTVRRGDWLYAMNKERNILKYSIAQNIWLNLDS